MRETNSFFFSDATIDLLLLDVTPLSLGIETSGQIQTVLIERNTKIPVSRTQTFSTASDNQTSVSVRVFEGERKLTKDCNLLGQFQLDGISPAPRGVPKITITYAISADGILSVSAVDDASGSKKVIFSPFVLVFCLICIFVQEIQVKNENRFSREEIERMVREASEMGAEDEKVFETIQAKNSLESVAYGLRNSIASSEMSADVKAKLEATVNETISWIDRNSSASKEEFDAKRTALEELVQQVAGNGQMPPQQKQSSTSRPTVEEVD